MEKAKEKRYVDEIISLREEIEFLRKSQKELFQEFNKINGRRG